MKVTLTKQTEDGRAREETIDFTHRPVLLDECIQALNIRPDGIYVDGTAGGGGHSSAIAAHLDAGRLTMNEAYELVCQFLLIWDCHYDHDMKMAGYADHELENTYTLGGCDGDGKPLFNELTRLFLRATREQRIIFPKINLVYLL